MKLTTKQLRQIIIEELRSVLVQEYEDDSYEDPEETPEGIPQIGDQIPENQEKFMAELKDKNLFDNALEDAYNLLFDYDEEYPDDPTNYSEVDLFELTLEDVKELREQKVFEMMLARAVVESSETFSGWIEEPIARFREILPAGSVTKKYAYKGDMFALETKLENSQELKSKVAPIYDFLEDFISGKIMGGSGPLLPGNFAGRDQQLYVNQIFELWRSMNGV